MDKPWKSAGISTTPCPPAATVARFGEYGSVRKDHPVNLQVHMALVLFCKHCISPLLQSKNVLLPAKWQRDIVRSIRKTFVALLTTALWKVRCGQPVAQWCSFVIYPPASKRIIRWHEHHYICRAVAVAAAVYVPSGLYWAPMNSSTAGYTMGTKIKNWDPHFEERLLRLLLRTEQCQDNKSEVSPYEPDIIIKGQ